MQLKTKHNVKTDKYNFIKQQKIFFQVKDCRFKNEWIASNETGKSISY